MIRLFSAIGMLTLAFLCFCLSPLLLVAQDMGDDNINTSVLSQGDWYKIAVSAAGVYKIDLAQLQSMGISTEAIDPRSIALYGNGGKMLPQRNGDKRIQDLQENPIFIAGEADGRFDQGDYLLFYASGPDDIRYSEEEGTFIYTGNEYDDRSYFFLTIKNDGEMGARLSSAGDQRGDFPIITTFDEVDVYEQDQHNLLTSGRFWYGERFSGKNLSRSFSFDATGTVEGSPLKLSSTVMAQTFTPTEFEVSINGKVIGQQPVQSIPDFENNPSSNTYRIKGYERKDIFEVSTAIIPSSSTSMQVTLSFNKAGSGRSLGYLEHLLLHRQRELSLYGEQTLFRSISSTSSAFSTYRISNGSPSLQVWDVSDPLSPKTQMYRNGPEGISFGTASITIREFIVFDPEATLGRTEYLGKVAPQNLHGELTPEFLIISHPQFIKEAERLARFRRNHDGLDVSVTNVDEIYNEFGSGSKDLSAIRDYVKFLYDKRPEKLKYLLLLGRCSYDYKDRISSNTNFIPTFQSPNTLHPLLTYSSDDYFGFMEEGEGEWSSDHTLEIGVGRLPVTSIEEANNVVDKIIAYSSNGSHLGAWRNEVVFIADDEDFNIHVNDADRLATMVDSTYTGFNINKIYMDAFEQVPGPGGELAPQVNEQINKAVEDGALIINFTGHGGEKKWTEENILDISTINAYNNSNNLPLFVTATCEFGRHDDPERISGGELTVLNENGGSIAIVTTARPVSSSTNFKLNRAFYETVFRKREGEYPRLGDIIRDTKNNSISGVSNRNFSLLGDPSLRLAYPEHRLEVTHINNNARSEVLDTLKALEKVKIEGSVLATNGSKIVDFNGTAAVTVYGKSNLRSTLGSPRNVKFNYRTRDNILFNGITSVREGGFSFEFVVPKNISYLIDKGKISMYSASDNTKMDAHVGLTDILIGGSPESIVRDDRAPQLSAFMNDTLFLNGSSISPNSTLLVDVFDENGVNLSNYSLGGNVPIAVLDDRESYPLSTFYTADLDSYQHGWFRLPLKGLSAGKHQLSVKIWDTHNNSSEVTVQFIVGNASDIIIEDLGNHPNPFLDETTITFNHNRQGEDLELKLQVFSPQGKVIHEQSATVNNAGSRISIPLFLKEKLFSGIYAYHLFVRSKSDGAKKHRYQKLVLIK